MTQSSVPSNLSASGTLNLEFFEQQLRDAPLSQIADTIRRDWKHPFYGAVPYLQAMLTLPSIESKFYLDDGKSIVLYFLSNAATWRGPLAKLVKKELNRRVRNCK